MMDQEKLEEFMKMLAFSAGKEIMPYFRHPVAVQNKSDKSQVRDYDPVTEADQASERIMRALIEQHFPNHGIFGEEYGKTREDAEYLWVLDPIDGTRAFMSGLPTWGVLIGLFHKGEPMAGVMYQPLTEELFFGMGASAHLIFKGERLPLSVRPCEALSQATLSTTSPLIFNDSQLASFRRVEEQVRISRYGCDCYAYCMVAAGSIDIVIESDLDSYDIAALIPIIEGAGGIVTNWQGGSAALGGNIVASGDRKIHDMVLRIIQDT